MLARPIEETSLVIQEGDLVIVYERYDRMKSVVVRQGEQLQNRYGLFPHSDWIGKPFGSRVSGKSGGFVHLLAPNPELWTCVLSHRTQILYLADISFVVSYLELRPGSLVLESGTGSGSLTTSLARAVAPTGHVYTFDFHEQRANSAREDFARNGLSDLVTVGVQDIQGLGFPDVHAGKIDSIFLDLPQPWLAIESASKMLRNDGIVCSFSPCIEQVQRTCDMLDKQDFTEIRTFEVLLRAYEVREETLAPLKQQIDLDDNMLSSPPYKKRCREEKQISTSPEDNQEGSCVGNTGKPDSVKRPGLVVARPRPETRGHTGYLTFAVKAS